VEQLPPTHPASLLACKAKNKPRRAQKVRVRKMVESGRSCSWPWDKKVTLFDKCSSESMRVKMSRELKKAVDEKDDTRARDIIIDRMLFTVYRWPWTQRKDENIIDCIQEGRGFCTLKGFFPEKFREGLNWAC
jgi:hypothetical protein